MKPDDKELTPQEKRRVKTADRLRAALQRLVAANAATGVTLSVAALAREAGIGRNAIYVNHRDIIADLLLAASQRKTNAEPPKECPPEADWRGIATDLRDRMRVLASENALLLKRALDAEQATTHSETRRTKLEPELRTLQSPARLPIGTTGRKH